jgi:hypothetical protein
MNAIDVMQGLKRREHRPLVFIAVGVLAYLVVVSWPRVFRALGYLWQDLRAFGIEDNSLGVCLLAFAISVLILLCLLASAAIWVLSIFVSWAAFRKSRRRAYLFILAYFLMPLLLTPTTWLSSKVFTKPELYRHQNTESKPEIVQVGPASPAVINRTIEAPIGPFLLLAGLWYLYRNERTMYGEQTRCSEPGDDPLVDN